MFYKKTIWIFSANFANLGENVGAIDCAASKYSGYAIGI
jgi:hypothetical protein